MTVPYMRRRSFWKPLLLAIAAVLALSWLSSLVVAAHMPWYAALEKPSYNPPDWAFGVVWPVLYVMMVVAAALAWRHPSRQKKAQVRQARMLFVVQLALNLAWTPVFFGLENPQYGLAWLGTVWLAATATLVAFWRLRPLAGALLVPYLAWLSFAVLLNTQILLLNQ